MTADIPTTTMRSSITVHAPPADGLEAASHYRNFLAPLYAWMLGDRTAAFDRARAELRALGVSSPALGGLAIDLGAGLGLQSIALAALGFRVLAVDQSPELLDALRAARPDVRTLPLDFVQTDEWARDPGELVVCMGDTLTHLSSQRDVIMTFERVAQCLEVGGSFVLTFRDYTASPGPAPSCFLVRGEADRILTVHLSYREGFVLVTDVLHEKGEEGWTVRASTYKKLRLSREWVAQKLEAAGLMVRRVEAAAGWNSVVATRS